MRNRRRLCGRSTMCEWPLCLRFNFLPQWLLRQRRPLSKRVSTHLWNRRLQLHGVRPTQRQCLRRRSVHLRVDRSEVPERTTM